MKPNNQTPEAVPGPTVPAHIRAKLLRATVRGVTTTDAAKEAGLSQLTAMKYLDLMRREGVVYLKPTGDGRGIEWWKTTKTRRSAS